MSDRLSDRQRLFHLTTRAELDAADPEQGYAPERFELDGFVHCCYLEQLSSVAARHFAGRDDLLLLEIDRAVLDCAVVEENLEGGSELYPHVYGKVRSSAICRIDEFRRDGEGSFRLPQRLGSA